MDSNGRMDRVEKDLAWLTEFTKTLAISAAKHDEQISRLIENAGKHDEEIQAIVGVTRLLIQKWDHFAAQDEKQTQRADRIDERLDKLSQTSQKNEEHLGILMNIMDEWIRTRGKEKE